MNTSVAVIVSTYNNPEVLRRVLDAYLQQSRPPDELIVADDGSTQITRQVIDEFVGRCSLVVQHIWHEDVGYRLAKIRNEAVKAAKADYLIFTDGDCIPHPYFVEDHLRHAQEGCFVQGKRMNVGQRLSETFVWPGPVVLAIQCLKGNISGAHHLLRVPALARISNRLHGIKTCNFAMFKADFVGVNGYNEEFVGWGREDSELVVRLFKYGLKRKDAPFSALVFHLWHVALSRDSVAENDALLQLSMDSEDTFCKAGMYKTTAGL